MKSKKQLLAMLIGALVVSILAFAACGGDELPPPPANWKALEAALDAAKLAKTDFVSSSLEGEDVDTDMYWVEVTEWDTLQQAISSAEAKLLSKSASKAEVDRMIKDLNDAAEPFVLAKVLYYQVGTFPYRVQLRTQIERADVLLLTVYVDITDDPTEIWRGEPYTNATIHNVLLDAVAEAERVVDESDLQAIEEQVPVLKEANDNFEAAKHFGTKPPNTEAIETLIASVPALKVNVLIQATTSNVPGLFLDFDKRWVTDTVDAALTAAVTAAQDFVDNIETTGTRAEAAEKQEALHAAIENYEPKEGLGLLFVDVPVGSFTRYTGTTALSTSGTNYSAVANITVPFKIAKYELTVGQWEAVMGTEGFPTDTGGMYDYFSVNANATNRGKFPAARLSWYDAIAFSNKLSAIMGKNLVYQVSGVSNNTETWKNLQVGDIPSGRPTGTGTDNNSAGNRAAAWDGATEGDRWKAVNSGYRMPSEWEWCWAAMGAYSDNTGQTTGTNTAGYRKAFAGQAASAVSTTGTTYNNRSNYAWIGLNNSNASITSNGTMQVGTKSPNELGIYDMSGNVAEWCFHNVLRDADGSNNNLAAASNGDTLGGTDIRGPAIGNNTRGRKLSKGGDWQNGASNYNTGDRTAVKDRPSIWNRTALLGHIGYTQTGIRLVISNVQ